MPIAKLDAGQSFRVAAELRNSLDYIEKSAIWPVLSLQELPAMIAMLIHSIMKGAHNVTMEYGVFA